MFPLCAETIKLRVSEILDNRNKSNSNITFARKNIEFLGFSFLFRRIICIRSVRIETVGCAGERRAPLLVLFDFFYFICPFPKSRVTSKKKKKELNKKVLQRRTAGVLGYRLGSNALFYGLTELPYFNFRDSSVAYVSKSRCQQ